MRLKLWVAAAMVLGAGCTDAGPSIGGTRTALAQAAGSQMLTIESRPPAVPKIVLPSHVLARRGEVPVTLELPQGFTGQARLRVAWRDSLGRMVWKKTLNYHLIDETSVTFRINMARAVAMKNDLSVHLTLNGIHLKGGAYRLNATVATDFIARPRYKKWNDYVIFMWQPYPKKLIPKLHDLGINAGVYSGEELSQPKYLIDTNTRWYESNLAPEYYGPYHRWHPDRGYDWQFSQTKKLLARYPHSDIAFKRHPSLENPYWVNLVRKRAIAAAKRLRPYRPLFYALVDEGGIGTLSTQWDFDMSSMSLSPMRRWLKRKYGSLGALNAEWGTHFKDWRLVMPETTTQAMERPGDNFSQWANFKEWMDKSFARSLKMGVDAIHSVDPRAYVGITGAQMPGWGGYDYARLAKVLGVMEPYDIGDSVNVAHSLNPHIVLLSTSFRGGPWEMHRVWHELLQGERGLIIWDHNHTFVHANGERGRRAVEAAPYYRELRDGEGALIINSTPYGNLIDVDYSQSSLRTQWMLSNRSLGSSWTKLAPNFKSADGDNYFAQLRASWVDLLQDLGFQANFISDQQIANGGLLARNSKVLVLPDSNSMSHKEASSIKRFVATGGMVISNGTPARFDQNSKQYATPLLADLFAGRVTHGMHGRKYRLGEAVLVKMGIHRYLRQRLAGRAEPTHRLIGEMLRRYHVVPSIEVKGVNGKPPIGVGVHLYSNGGVQLIALESTPQISTSVLGSTKLSPNKAFSHPVRVQVRLPTEMYVYDTLTQKPLGRMRDITESVGPYQPTILAVSNVQLPKMSVTVPSIVRRGSIVRVSVHIPRGYANANVFHVEVVDPKGKRMNFYSGNIIGSGGVRMIPLAYSDPVGEWTVKVHDIMSGQTITRRVRVE